MSENTNTNLGFGVADLVALRGIFRLLCIFVVFLFLVHTIEIIDRPTGLETALAQFIPFCLVLGAVIYRGRTLARFDKPTLLMASCLAAVFVIFACDVTRNLKWLDGAPILGRHSRMGRELVSLAIMVAVASFPAACYLMMQKMLLAKHHLEEQVEKLEEALRHVRRLQGLLPICMHCHKIRTDEQTWQRIELYISEHSDATFSHGLCPECADKYYPVLQSRTRSSPKSGPPSLRED